MAQFDVHRNIGKRKAEIDAQLQAEQSRLSGICSASRGWMLGTENNPAAKDTGDVICIRTPDPKPEASKGK